MNSKAARELVRGIKFPALLISSAWLAFVLATSLVPVPPRLPLISQRAELAIGHIAGYLVLTVLCYIILIGFMKDKQFVRRIIIACIAGVGAWFVGLIVEIVQELVPNRSAESSDLLLNALGAVIGVAFVLLLRWLLIDRGKLTIAAALVAVTLMTTTGVSAVVWDRGQPRVGDHWHASYSIMICDKQMEPLQVGPGSVHTHGDGMIHIHPVVSSESGSNANLALFFKSIGGEITDSSLTLNGERYQNGDGCPNGDVGTLSVFGGGSLLNKPSAYGPRDGDTIEILFGKPKAN